MLCSSGERESWRLCPIPQAAARRAQALSSVPALLVGPTLIRETQFYSRLRLFLVPVLVSGITGLKVILNFFNFLCAVESYLNLVYPV